LSRPCGLQIVQRVVDSSEERDRHFAALLEALKSGAHFAVVCVRPPVVTRCADLCVWHDVAGTGPVDPAVQALTAETEALRAQVQVRLSLAVVLCCAVA
jgi:hypothetical protein